MTPFRILLAGILGGVAMFIWSFVAHDLLPLGEIGMRELPNEQPVLDNLKANLTDDGLYHYPGGGHPKNATRQEKKAAMKAVFEKVASGPSGLILYHPTRAFSFGKLLCVEFAKELLGAILAVFLLAQTRINSFGGRVGFVLVVGIIAAMGTNVSFWNWYAFPGNYIASSMFMEIVGFLCVGLVAALVLRRQTAN